ncbi:hypothetical protein LUZ61_012951 [Rhynchospora tenuis]|uniref:Glycosyltransferase 61 catalytic domain-containing protein n=1 Tax=Rhynchospora tenuis TaxID=198213 RepID=A0AAD6A3U6_9POAL|nr:hypothetical protein LUZ61_012951 [Rhynchospora tenuis]
MSTLVGHPTHGLLEHFVFPSQRPNDKILCVDAHKKLYVLAKSRYSFPAGSFHVAPGLTYLADSFYDYENPWHGLNAISPFFSWRRERGQCQNPMRFMLFKRGDVVVKKVGNWVRGLMEANLDRRVTINDNELLTKGFNGGSGNKSTMVCFERAVVMRRGLGGMKGNNRQRLFDMVRCKAWRFCGVDHDVDGKDGDRLSNNNGAATSTDASAVRVQVSLLLREGKRGFANETQVRDVIRRECSKLASKCELRVIHLASAGGNANRSNTSFCNQVRSMRKTDIVVTTHGGQLTNMVFMPPGSSVMEMFPTGWLEGAGSGQFIYLWFAGWSRMHYENAWRDPHGIRCPYPNFASSSTSSTSNNKSDITNMMKRCFAIRQKNQKVGVDEVYLARWISKVLAKAIIRKVKLNLNTTTITPKCACD